MSCRRHYIASSTIFIQQPSSSQQSTSWAAASIIYKVHLNCYCVPPSAVSNVTSSTTCFMNTSRLKPDRYVIIIYEYRVQLKCPPDVSNGVVVVVSSSSSRWTMSTPHRMNVPKTPHSGHASAPATHKRKILYTNVHIDRS